MLFDETIPYVSTLNFGNYTLLGYDYNIIIGDIILSLFLGISANVSSFINFYLTLTPELNNNHNLFFSSILKNNTILEI